MGDDIVTPLAGGISPSSLYVLHSQLPQGQIVGQHVEVGQEGGAQGICLRR